VVDAEPARGELLHLAVAAPGEVALEALPLAVRVVAGARVEQVDDALGDGLLAQRLGRLDRVLARVDKHHALVAVLDELGDLVERGLVEVGARLHRTRLALDADKVLLERDRAERRVEEEEAGVSVHAEEVGDVDIVGEGRREADDADEALHALDLALRAGDDRLDDGAAVLVQEVDLVDDEELDLLLDVHGVSEWS